MILLREHFNVVAILMIDKISRSDRELCRRIDEVVHYVWDPVGVSDHPQARREYRTYIKPLYEHVKNGGLEDILAYMKQITTENMGLHFNEYHAIRAAQVMLDWRDYVDSQPIEEDQIAS